MLTAKGNVIESDLSIKDIVQKSTISEFAILKLQSPTGGKLLMSTADGNIIQSSSLVHIRPCQCLTELCASSQSKG